jgi:hypothetical protein
MLAAVLAATMDLEMPTVGVLAEAAEVAVVTAVGTMVHLIVLHIMVVVVALDHTQHQHLVVLKPAVQAIKELL